MRKASVRRVLAGLTLVSLVAAGCATYIAASRATREAMGPVEGGAQVRYKEAPFRGVRDNFEQWPTYSDRDTKKYSEPRKVSVPADIKGNPALGRKLFMDRNKGPCTGCHLIQGGDVWPAGNIGPDLSTIGDRQLADYYLYQYTYDPRVFNPDTVMPPWGTAGIFTPQEIVHIVAFLKTQKGPLPPEKDPARNPNTRPKPGYYYGDNLDPATNAAVLLAESAHATWSKKEPAGKSCADCHAGGIEKAMKGVATKYPKFVPKYGRMMSIEDVIAWHGIDETGLALQAQSADNVNLSVLIKMQSNGMPVNVDIASPEAKAAYERGKTRFYARVGQRNHSCADCHDAARGGGKYLGGRLLGDVTDGLTKHFPTFRTNLGVAWDMRKRMQWCMLPLGTNYLPADAVEYAEIELYLTAFDNGKRLSVPGIRH